MEVEKYMGEEIEEEEISEEQIIKIKPFI